MRLLATPFVHVAQCCSGGNPYSLLPFRNRIRMYPAFVNCTTIDWFSEWPQDALLEVAEKYVENMDLGDDEVTYNAPC